jgi:hypothetical protein
MEELSEIVYRWRKHHLIVRTSRQIEDWYSEKPTDGLGIYSDDVSINSGLQYHHMLIILSHLKVA